ncbi:hypothetical protein SK128_019876 [Halocaridina rubra]|uniref:Ig-like domain-containing protein n=1 Tax=Halocaridina rubra TaxID=373956 RepID=A0AAN8XFD3_HALRR
MKAASEYGLVLHYEKCEILKDSIEFYGVVRSKDGIKLISRIVTILIIVVRKNRDLCLSLCISFSRAPQPRVESVTASPTTVGEDITVSCVVSHWTAQVLFIHNGNAVDPSIAFRYSVRQQSHGRRGPNTITHTLIIKDATRTDSGVVECFINFEVFGATNITVTGTDDPSSFGKPNFSLSPGRIVELRGPDMVETGSTLSLVCLISPVIQQQDAVLVHDVFLLFVGGIKITEDPRIQIHTDNGEDGSRAIYITIREVTNLNIALLG